MSDSETGAPSAAAISRAVRDVVIAIHKSSNEDITVNRVRTGAEEKLGLPAGFLKNAEWKNKSRDLIKDAVDRYCGDEPEPMPTPKKVSNAKPKVNPEPRKKNKATNDSAPRAPKRKAAAPAKKPQKRRKAVSSDEESDAVLSDSPAQDSEQSDVESEPQKPARRQKVPSKPPPSEDKDAGSDDNAESETTKPARRQNKVVAEDTDEEGEGEVAKQNSLPNKEHKDAGIDAGTGAAPSDEEPGRHATPPPAPEDDASESEMSDVIDESPVKKRRQKKTSTEKPAKEPKGAKAKPKAIKSKKTEDDPDQAEIKRLQGWLVKCGIRKVWGKELAKCDTSKDKIRHLKGMLKDAGMDGKPSVEKAAKIKEQREFAKDLEEIQAGAASWGETSTTGRPRRAAARAVKPIVYHQDDDDDEGEQQEKAEDFKDEGTDDDDDDDEVQGESESDDSAGRDSDEDSD